MRIFQFYGRFKVKECHYECVNTPHPIAKQRG